MQLERTCPGEEEHATNRCDTGRETTLFPDGDLLTAEHCRRRSDLELLSQRSHEVCTSPDRRNTGQLRERQRAADPICHETYVSLEFGDSGMSAVAEDSVDTARVEP